MLERQELGRNSKGQDAILSSANQSCEQRPQINFWNLISYLQNSNSSGSSSSDQLWGFGQVTWLSWAYTHIYKMEILITRLLELWED